jgi:hypothetical protein
MIECVGDQNVARISGDTARQVELPRFRGWYALRVLECRLQPALSDLEESIVHGTDHIEAA